MKQCNDLLKTKLNNNLQVWISEEVSQAQLYQRSVFLTYCIVWLG
jgi:hypothetical protein